MLSLIVGLSLALTSEEPARPETPPTKESLAKISDRGRLLAGYDNAAWHGSDAVMKLKPDKSLLQRYIARKGEKGWVVSFGRLSDAGDQFLIAYEATETEAPDRFLGRKVDPPRKETGFELLAANAIDVALADFSKNPPARRPYNVAVLPAEGDKVWVYLFPAPTKPGVWPIGGDARYLVASDGPKIVEKRQLHKSIIELDRPAPEKDQKLMMGMHTHVLDNIPEDTDVFHVLIRKPPVGEVITTPVFAYTIDVDGSIKFIGKSEDLGKQ